MADKEFSIEMTTANSERNAGRLLADLQSIQREIKGVTEASASMDIKSKKLTGTLLQQVSAAQKVRIAFKDTKEGLKLVGISAVDTSRKLAALAVIQNKLARQEAGSAKLNFLVQKGRELELLKESIRLKIQEGKLEKANVALRGKVDTGAKLTRLKEEQSLINKIHSIERARLRTEKSLITDPAKRTRDLAAATRAEAKSKQQVAIASKKAAIANQRLSAVNEKATKSTTDLNISWTSLVRLLSAQVIYRAVFGMAAQLKQAFDNAVELQVAISELQTIAPPTESFGEFAVVLREVSDKFGLDIIEATEAGYQALSNQIVDTAAEMGRFLEVMGRLSIATRSTLAESVNLATGVLNAYRLGVEDAEEVSAKLFKTIELGRVRAEEMANSLGNVAILANQVGFSLDELLGLITTLTIQGIKFSEAQTQIRGILIKLIKPTRAMTEFLRDLGFESGEAAIKALGLIKFLALMSERTGDSTTEIAKLINRVRGLSGALAVTGKGFFLLQRNIDEISKKSMPAFNRAITLVLDNQGKKFQIFQNQLKNFFTQDIGQEFVSALSSLVFGFDNLLTVMKLLANTVVNVMVPVIVAGLATMTKSFVALIIAMGPFGIAISAILVAGTAFVTLLRSMRFHAERMEDAFNAMNAAAREVSDEIENTLGRALNDLADSFRDVFESISGNIAAAAAKELGALEKAVQSIGDLFEAIGDALEESIDAASDKIEDMVDTFESGLKAITKLIKKISNEFARISLSAKEAAFEITFDAATPAQQAQLLTDKLKDLQAVLGSTIDFDIFVKTQKEIEKTLFRQQNIAQKAIDIEEKRAKKTVKDRDKLIRDLEKLEKRLVKEQAKSRKFKGRVPVSGGRDEQEIGQLIEKINELKEQGRNLEAIISGFKIGGFDIGAGGAEEIRRAAEDAEQKLAADVVKQFESGAISAERLLEVLDNVAKAAQQSSQDNLDFAESQKTRLESLTKFFEGLDKKALADIFDAKSVEKFEQDITEIEAKLKSLATLQGQLGVDNSATIQKSQDILKAALADRESIQIRIQANAVTTAKLELESAQELKRQEIQALIDRKAHLEGLIAAVSTLTETRERGVFERGGAGGGSPVKTAILSDIMKELTSGIGQGAIPAIQAAEKALLDFTNLPNEDEQIKLINALQELKQVMQISSDATITFKDAIAGLTDFLGVTDTELSTGGTELSTDEQSNFESQQAALDKFGELLRALVEIQEKQTIDDPDLIPKSLNELRQAIVQGQDEIAESAAKLANLQEQLLNLGIGAEEVIQDSSVTFKNAVDKFEIAVIKLTKIIPAKNKARGGIVAGIGSSDSVPTMLTPGEFVVNKNSTGKFISQLIGINRSKSAPQQLNQGGLVEVGGVNISVTDSGNPRATARAVANELNRSIRQGTIQLRR